MKKFKKGDRVVALDSCKGQFTAGKVYKVADNYGNCIGIVRDDEGEPNGWGIHHFRHARKLKDKRRRVFITERALEGVRLNRFAQACISSHRVVDGDVEFVEVRRKKKGNK